MVQLFGLIGFPLDHSFSEGYFTKKIKQEKIRQVQYLNFPLPTIEELPSLVKNHPGLMGLNVTIPYKEKVIAYMDELDSVAREVGAVNTIKISREKKEYFLKGYNTDVYGFETSLLERIDPIGKQALVLGSGGASKAVTFVLKKLHIPVTIVSRKSYGKGVIRYNQLNRNIISKNHLIVNTTPLGMFPKTNSYPYIPYHFLTKNHILFDLIYNPPQTLFLDFGKKQGTLIINGQRMLEKQAEGSWNIWRE